MDAPVSLEHAVHLTRKRNRYRVKEATRQARDDLAELMANGCPSISAAARIMRIAQNRADQHWQRIKADLGVAQCR